MIVTVTLNPAIDYVVSSDTFETGRINRYSSCTYGPGGKGINVSLLLTSLGVENLALGVAAGFSGREISRLLEERGCRADFHFLPQGHTRINVKVCTGSGEETDLTGGGPEIPFHAVERLEEKLSVLKEGDILVLAGSLPESLPENTYALLLESVAGKGVRTVVDAAGNALLSALPQRPYLVKPNQEELGELFGVEIGNVAEAADRARELQAMGAENVVVSMGEKGALLVEKTGRRLFCRSPKGRAVSTSGAGDSLVAGLLYGENLHGTLEGGLRWGVAAGAATAFQAGVADGETVKKLFPSVGNPYPI